MRKRGIILLMCALALLASGCRKRKVVSAPPVRVPVETAPQQREPAPPPQPEVKPEPVPEPPPTLVVPPPKPAPAKARPKTQPPTPEPPATEPASPKTVPPPRISPRLSPAEQAEYRQKTIASINVAERNLQAAGNRSLNAAQHDLVEKVRGFLGQAREAMAASDWVRAQNLAQKAEVLSEELLRSL